MIKLRSYQSRAGSKTNVNGVLFLKENLETHPQREDSVCAKSSPTLCGPQTVAHQSPLSMKFPKQEYWSRLPSPIPGIFPTTTMTGWVLYHQHHLRCPRGKTRGRETGRWPIISQRKRPLLRESIRRNQPCQHLHFGFLGSGTMSQ